MKLKFISMAVFSALTLGVATSASAVTTVNGGTVHFKGEVVDAACAVSLNSFDQTVSLGQVRSAKLKNDGDKSAPVGFNIELVDCDTQTSNNVSIIFSGAQPAGKDKVLAVQGGAGTATNVGIKVLDYKGQEVSFDGTTPSSEYVASSNSASIPFQAFYVAVNGQATAGTANADATFKVQYQ